MSILGEIRNQNDVFSVSSSVETAGAIPVHRHCKQYIWHAFTPHRMKYEFGQVPLCDEATG